MLPKLLRDDPRQWLNSSDNSLPIAKSVWCQLTTINYWHWSPIIADVGCPIHFVVARGYIKANVGDMICRPDWNPRPPFLLVSAKKKKLTQPKDPNLIGSSGQGRRGMRIGRCSDREMAVADVVGKTSRTTKRRVNWQDCWQGWRSRIVGFRVWWMKSRRWGACHYYGGLYKKLRCFKHRGKLRWSPMHCLQKRAGAGIGRRGRKIWCKAK